MHKKYNSMHFFQVGYLILSPINHVLSIIYIMTQDKVVRT